MSYLHFGDLARLGLVSTDDLPRRTPRGFELPPTTIELIAKGTYFKTPATPVVPPRGLPPKGAPKYGHLTLDQYRKLLRENPELLNDWINTGQAALPCELLFPPGPARQQCLGKKGGALVYSGPPGSIPSAAPPPPPISSTPAAARQRADDDLFRGIIGGDTYKRADPQGKLDWLDRFSGRLRGHPGWEAARRFAQGELARQRAAQAAARARVAFVPPMIMPSRTFAAPGVQATARQGAAVYQPKPVTVFSPREFGLINVVPAPRPPAGTPGVLAPLRGGLVIS